MEFEVNTWKRFQHYNKEVRISGRGVLLVSGSTGVPVAAFVAAGKSPLRWGKETTFPPSLAKAALASAIFDLSVPVMNNLRVQDSGPTKSPQEVVFTTKQVLSDIYSESVRLVGARTNRLETVKPSARDVQITEPRFLKLPIWDVTFGVEGTAETFHEVVSGFDGTTLSVKYLSCSKGFHEIAKGAVRIDQCGHTSCPDHTRTCITCNKQFCWSCSVDASCGHSVCEKDVRKCSVEAEAVCENCGRNSCGHLTCQSHRKSCENCGKTLCVKCIIEKGLFRKRYACSSQCASFL